MRLKSALSSFQACLKLSELVVEFLSLRFKNFVFVALMSSTDAQPVIWPQVADLLSFCELLGTQLMIVANVSEVPQNMSDKSWLSETPSVVNISVGFQGLDLFSPFKIFF